MPTADGSDLQVEASNSHLTALRGGGSPVRRRRFFVTAVRPIVRPAFTAAVLR